MSYDLSNDEYFCSARIYTNGTNPDDYFGHSVVIYAEQKGTNNNREEVALCIIDDNSAQDTIEIAASDLYGTDPVIFPGEKNTEGTNTSKYVKLYYKTVEDSKPQYVPLLDCESYGDFCSLVVNGIEQEAIWNDIANYKNGVIKLIDTKTYDVSEGKNYPGSDGIYEKVIIDTFFDFVVAEVDVEEGIISTQEGIDITLDESKIYAITDLESNTIAIEDLKENDVLSVYCDEIDKENVDSAEVISIVVYNKIVEGKITEMTSNKKVIYIDGKKYTLANGLVADNFNLEDEGTFI
jgi:hypothetical protein